MSDELALVVAALAVSHVIEVWNHGSLFADWRAWLETEPLGGSITTLFRCMFCLTVWVAAVVFLLDNLGGVGRSLVWVLALSRLANLINDLTYPLCRTPK